ncbi:MAG TPA: hypothetical protein VFG69_02520 [Nannocystaceae bacterium]|nr:hypothetical protein [Nannocystaceae bacterium]
MQSTLTDWQGKLRVADVVGDSLRILVRRPALAVLAPAACLALAGWCAYELDAVGRLFPGLAGASGLDVWTWAVQLVLAVPMIAFCWALLADVALLTPGSARVARSSRLARATMVATALVLVMLVLAFSVGVFAIVAMPLVGSAVPVAACERLGPFAALRRAVSLTDGNRLRLLAAWFLLELVVSLGVVAIGVAIFVLAHATDVEILLGVGWSIALLFQALYLALAVSTTTALSIAAYGRLRQARVELDVDALVEVFR